MDAEFIPLRRIDDHIILRRPEVHHFKALVLHLRRPRERVAMPHHEPELAINRVHLNARRALPTMMLLEPHIQITRQLIQCRPIRHNEPRAICPISPVRLIAPRPTLASAARTTEVFKRREPTHPSLVVLRHHQRRVRKIQLNRNVAMGRFLTERQTKPRLDHRRFQSLLSLCRCHRFNGKQRFNQRIRQSIQSQSQIRHRSKIIVVTQMTGWQCDLPRGKLD